MSSRDRVTWEFLDRGSYPLLYPRVRVGLRAVWNHVIPGFRELQGRLSLTACVKAGPHMHAGGAQAFLANLISEIPVIVSFAMYMSIRASASIRSRILIVESLDSCDPSSSYLRN